MMAPHTVAQAPRSVLVIGGASGIGRAISERFIASGHRVCVADIDLAQLERTGRALGCDTVALDVRIPAQVAQAVARATGDSALDVAVNCAGVEGRVDFLTQQDDESLQRVMEVNALGTLYALKYELAQMVSQGHGAICSVASMLGLRGQPRWAGYCASKHAVVGATRAAALEVAHLGIRVNAVAPGLIATPLLERASGGRMQERAAIVPTRGLGTPEDIAHAVHWLCSDEARYATGTILSVDGGATAQVATTPDFSAAPPRQEPNLFS